MERKDLIEAAVETIINDCRVGDFTAIYELLDRVPEDVLANFLPEEKLMEIKEAQASLILNKIYAGQTKGAGLAGCDNFHRSY